MTTLEAPDNYSAVMTTKHGPVEGGLNIEAHTGSPAGPQKEQGLGRGAAVEAVNRNKSSMQTVTESEPSPQKDVAVGEKQKKKKKKIGAPTRTQKPGPERVRPLEPTGGGEQNSREAAGD